ncbi:hypothetical protein U1Q18_038154 [Sarracenia purpurea var. burkii]
MVMVIRLATGVGGDGLRIINEGGGDKSGYSITATGSSDFKNLYAYTGRSYTEKVLQVNGTAINRINE